MSKNLTKFQSKNNTIFYLCDCKNEVLVLSHDYEFNLTDLCIYQSYSNKLSLWQKFRHIYSILIKNKPYLDQITLNKDQLISLKAFITDII